MIRPDPIRRRLAVVDLQGVGPFATNLSPANTPGTITYVPPSDPAPAKAPMTAGVWLAAASGVLTALALLNKYLPGDNR
jgi:hypothetical protein